MEIINITISETASTFINALALALIPSIIGGCIAFWGITTQRNISRQKNSLDFEAQYKRNEEIANHNKNIIEFISKLQNKEIQNHKEYLVDLASPKSRIVSDELTAEEIGKKEQLSKSISIVLNEWERAANATFTRLYDGNYLYRAHGTTILQIYTYLHPYIQERQKANPRYFIHLTRLCITWGIRRCKEDKSEINLKIRSYLSKVDESGIEFLGHEVRESRHKTLCTLQKETIKIGKILNKKNV